MRCSSRPAARRRRRSQTIVARLSPRPDVPTSLRKLPAPGAEAAPAAAASRADPGRCGGGGSARARSRATSVAGPGGRDRAALTGPLQARAHDRGRYGREAAAGERHARRRDSVGRRRGDHRSGADGAAGGSGEEEVRRYAQAAPVPRHQARGAPHRGRGQACRLGAGPRALRVRGDERPPLQRAPVPAVPSPRPVRPGRRGDVDQIALRCRRHNDYEGRLYFGRRRRADGSAQVRRGQGDV